MFWEVEYLWVYLLEMKRPICRQYIRSQGVKQTKLGTKFIQWLENGNEVERKLVTGIVWVSRAGFSPKDTNFAWLKSLAYRREMDLH